MNCTSNFSFGSFLIAPSGLFDGNLTRANRHNGIQLHAIVIMPLDLGEAGLDELDTSQACGEPLLKLVCCCSQQRN